MLVGIVIRGEGIATELGYATANLDITPENSGLADGVYAAWSWLGEEKYPAALAVISSRQKVEVHLIGYKKGTLLGQTLRVEPVQKVSEIEPSSGEELKKKIKQDIEVCFQVLSTRSEE